MEAKLGRPAVETTRREISLGERPFDRARFIPDAARGVAKRTPSRLALRFTGKPRGRGPEKPGGGKHIEYCRGLAAGEAMQQQPGPAGSDAEGGGPIVVRRATAHPPSRIPAAAEAVNQGAAFLFDAWLPHDRLLFRVPPVNPPSPSFLQEPYRYGVPPRRTNKPPEAGREDVAATSGSLLPMANRRGRGAGRTGERPVERGAPVTVKT